MLKVGVLTQQGMIAPIAIVRETIFDEPPTTILKQATYRLVRPFLASRAP